MSNFTSNRENHQTCLFPGRFQPPHIGHVAALKELCQLYHRVIVVISNAHISHTAKNPFTGGERYALFREICQVQHLFNVDIVPIPSDPLETTWVATIRTLAPPYDCVFGRNPMITTLFEYWGDQIVSINVPRLTSATTIRIAMAKNKNWNKLVSEETISLLNGFNCQARLSLLLQDDNI